MADYSYALVNCINHVRKYPSHYAALINQQSRNFVGPRSLKIGHIICETEYGRPAWQEAIDCLLKQSTLPPLAVNDGLSMAARDHAIDQTQKGVLEHVGSDGSGFFERVKRYCRYDKGKIVYLLAGAYVTGGSIVELLVLNLLVDDGLKGRGDRNAILSQDYGYIGAYVIEQQDSAIGVIVLSESKLQLLTGEELLSAQRSHMLSSQTKSGLKESFRRMKLPEEPLWTFQKVNSSYSMDNGLDQQPSIATAVFYEEFKPYQRGWQNEVYSTSVGSRDDYDHKEIDLSGKKSTDNYNCSYVPKKIMQKLDETKEWTEGNFLVREYTIKVYYSDGSEDNITKRQSTYRPSK